MLYHAVATLKLSIYQFPDGSTAYLLPHFGRGEVCCFENLGKGSVIVTLSGATDPRTQMAAITSGSHCTYHYGEYTNPAFLLPDVKLMYHEGDSVYVWRKTVQPISNELIDLLLARVA